MDCVEKTVQLIKTPSSPWKPSRTALLIANFSSADLYHACGDGGREAEAYQMQANFSQLLIKVKKQTNSLKRAKATQSVEQWLCCETDLKRISNKIYSTLACRKTVWIELISDKFLVLKPGTPMCEPIMNRLDALVLFKDNYAAHQCAEHALITWIAQPLAAILPATASSATVSTSSASPSAGASAIAGSSQMMGWPLTFLRCFNGNSQIIPDRPEKTSFEYLNLFSGSIFKIFVRLGICFIPNCLFQEFRNSISLARNQTTLVDSLFTLSFAKSSFFSHAKDVEKLNDLGENSLYCISFSRHVPNKITMLVIWMCRPDYPQWS